MELAARFNEIRIRYGDLFARARFSKLTRVEVFHGIYAQIGRGRLLRGPNVACTVDFFKIHDCSPLLNRNFIREEGAPIAPIVKIVRDAQATSQRH